MELPLRIGIHTSIAGSLDQAAHRAAELGANTFQIFSASPRMWKTRLPTAAETAGMREARTAFDLAPLVVHDSYLINLAAVDEALRKKSVAAFRGELERAVIIGAEYLVAHPGSYKGQTLDEGVRRVAKSVVEAARGLELNGMMLLLENTAGSGSAIGSRFEELAEIRRLAEGETELAIGYCLDTAHCLAAGYDVATAKGLRETVKAAEAALGLDSVRVIHANDSKAPIDSRVDRHEQIGKGHIGEDGFRRILRHPKLRGKPFILETPVEEEGDDRRNVEKLKELCRRSSTTTKRSSPSGRRSGK
jgi:deoxyribonuclease IV